MATSEDQHAIEVARGKRFEFGKNWRRFLAVLDEGRITAAEESLTTMLDNVVNWQGKRFLDVGCGSGLFSVAARRLGARVHSLDYDHEAVACAQELKRRYFPDDPLWIIEGGSVLDLEYLKSLGKFDIVYAWGVLHHTGQMWKALENVHVTVEPGGYLFVSIYNDQGKWTKFWNIVKQVYNMLPKYLKLPFAMLIAVPREMKSALYSLVALKPHRYIRYWTQYKQRRGMSRWHDIIDWVGGYPFEVAKPEEIFDFYHKRGFVLVRLKTCGGGHGCNEFVFKRYG